MLDYGEPQVAIGITFLVLALLIATIFLVVARHTTADVPLEHVQTAGYWLRKRWLALLGLLLVTSLTHVLFFGEDRYHLVITPVLCILAAAALRGESERSTIAT